MRATWRMRIPIQATASVQTWIPQAERKYGCTICAEEIRTVGREIEILIGARRKPRKHALEEAA